MYLYYVLVFCCMLVKSVYPWPTLDRTLETTGIEAQDEAAPLTLKTPGLFVHGAFRRPNDISKEVPIVVMIHGFPESYVWQCIGW